MSISLVKFNGVAKSALALQGAATVEAMASPDAAVVAACEAARAAMTAFDEAARRGDGFGALCELSLIERSALSAVCGTRASTPTGIAQKALLLEGFLSAARRSEATREAADFALSLANDAVALAKTLAGAGGARRAGKTATA